MLWLLIRLLALSLVLAQNDTSIETDTIPDTTTSTSTPTTTPVTGTPGSECINTPTLPSCQDYFIPDPFITLTLNNLCSSTPTSTGCSIKKACNSSRISLKYCSPMSLLADLCIQDSTSPDCSDYRTFCSITTTDTNKIDVSLLNNTTVKQCTLNPPFPGLPTTQHVQSQLTTLCTTNTTQPLRGCNTTSSDILMSLSNACKSLPDTQPECQTWKNMCLSYSSASGMSPSQTFTLPYCNPMKPNYTIPNTYPIPTVIPRGSNDSGATRVVTGMMSGYVVMIVLLLMI